MAANNGESQAKYILGLYYLQGKVVNRCFRAAEYWLSKAEEEGVNAAGKTLKRFQNGIVGGSDNVLMALFLNSLI